MLVIVLLMPQIVKSELNCAIIKWKIVSVTKDTENWNPHILLMGMLNGATCGKG